MPNPVALVTGASRGIGKQVAIDLAAAGYDVVCVSRSSAARPGKLEGTIEETAELVRAQGRRAMPVAVDVRDEVEVARLAGIVYNEWGRCDLLVNNAGIAFATPALEDSTKRWRLVIDVNLHGPFYFLYYFAPRMAVGGGGHVVNISSQASVDPYAGLVSYTASKAALEALTGAIAHELAGRVSVNAIRLEVPVWSEGYEANFGDARADQLEHPVIMSDAVLWFARQPVTHSGHTFTIADLRERGAVRPQTLYHAPS